MDTAASRRPSRYAIAQHWASEAHFVPSIEVPACFACTLWLYDCDPSQPTAARWNRSGLERAHLIAASIGGTAYPGNFLLLCEDCHIAAPMSDSCALLLAWARNRKPAFAVLMEELRETIPEALMESQHTTLAEFLTFLRARKFGLHPRSTFRQKFGATALLMREFLASRQGIP